MSDRAGISPQDVISTTPMSRHQWLVFGLCGLLMMIEGFDIQAMAFAAPEISREWQISSSHFGPVFSAGLFGGIFGGALIAPLGDRFGAKRVLIFSTICFGLFTLLTIFATTLNHLIFLRVIAGIGITAAIPCIIAILASYSPAHLRSTIVVSAFCFQLFGAVVGGVVSAELMQVYGWHSVFVFGGIIPLLLIPAVIALLPEPVTYLISQNRTEELQTVLRKMDKLSDADAIALQATQPASPQTSKPNMLELLHDGRAVGTIFMWLTDIVGVMFFYFLANWLPSILRDSGASMQVAVLGGVALNAGGLIGALILSRLLGKFGMNRTIAMGYICGAILIFTVGLPGWPMSVSLVLVFLAGFFGAGVHCCLSALAVSFYPPQLHSTAIGSTFAFGRLGAVVGPLIGGVLLAGGAQPRELFYFAAAAAASAGIFTLGIRMRKSK